MLFTSLNKCIELYHWASNACLCCSVEHRQVSVWVIALFYLRLTPSMWEPCFRQLDQNTPLLLLGTILAVKKRCKSIQSIQLSEHWLWCQLTLEWIYEYLKYQERCLPQFCSFDFLVERLEGYSSVAYSLTILWTEFKSCVTQDLHQDSIWEHWDHTLSAVGRSLLTYGKTFRKPQPPVGL